MPKDLQDQFARGTISYSFTPDTITFKGFIQGDGKNLKDLLKKFEKYRGKTCVSRISFEGQNGKGNFEWRPAVPAPKPTSACDVDNAINNGVFKDQIGENFTFNYNPDSRELEFKGQFGDNKGKGRFVKLIDELESFMNNGCISKINFVRADTKDKLFNPGFEWQLCENGMCECNGTCVDCKLGCSK